MGGMLGGGSGGFNGTSFIGDSGGINLSGLPFVGGLFPNAAQQQARQMMADAANTYGQMRPGVAQGFQNIWSGVQSAYTPAERALFSMYGGGGAPGASSGPPPGGPAPVRTADIGPPMSPSPGAPSGGSSPFSGLLGGFPGGATAFGGGGGFPGLGGGGFPGLGGGGMPGMGGGSPLGGLMGGGGPLGGLLGGGGMPGMGGGGPLGGLLGGGGSPGGGLFAGLFGGG